MVQDNSIEISLEESEDLDEATTDSTSFQAQVSTKKKDSNMDYKYNKTPMEDLKILMKQSSSLFIDIRICQQMSTLIILDWILVIWWWILKTWRYRN